MLLASGANQTEHILNTLAGRRSHPFDCLMMTPVPGIITLEPKDVLTVVVMETQLPSLSAVSNVSGVLAKQIVSRSGRHAWAGQQ